MLSSKAVCVHVFGGDSLVGALKGGATERILSVRYFQNLAGFSKVAYLSFNHALLVTCFKTCSTEGSDVCSCCTLVSLDEDTEIFLSRTGSLKGDQ